MTAVTLRPATVLRIAVLAMAVFSLQIVTSNTAAASCGDWLAGHETAATDGATVVSEVVQLRDVVSRFGFEASGSERSTTRPCSGPDCRQLPTMPDAPLAPVTTRVIAPQWLLGMALTNLPGLSVSGRVAAEQSAVLLPAEQDRIERPPRSC